MSIWTAVIAKDIQIPRTDQDAAEKLRTTTITAGCVSWLLGIGWIFYFGSLFLNLVYYLMHPSSPEMWTWGAEEKLEEWTPPEEKETEKRKQSIREQKNQTEASQMEMAELLPQESDENMQMINDCTN